MGDNIYFDSLRCKQFKYGIKISGQVDKIIEELEKHRNSKGYVNLEIKQRKQEGKYGETHYIVVDTWQPSGQQSNQSQSSERQSEKEEEAPATTSAPDDDLPF